MRLDLVVQGSYYLDAANSARYPGHELINLSWRRGFKSGWSLGVKLRNLANRRYAERADFAFGNYRYFPGAGRQLFVDINWRSAK